MSYALLKRQKDKTTKILNNKKTKIQRYKKYCVWGSLDTCGLSFPQLIKASWFSFKVDCKTVVTSVKSKPISSGTIDTCRNTKYVEINLITKIRIPQWPSTKRVIGAASTGALDKSQSFYALQHSFPEKPIFWFCKFKQQPLKLYPNSHMYPCYHNSNRLLLLSQSLQVSQGLLLQVSFIGLK